MTASPSMTLDQVVSTIEINKLISQFGYLLDDADFEGMADLLAHAGFGSPELGRSAFKGRDAILEQHLRTSDREGTAKTKQVYSSIIVDVADGADRATAKITFTCFHATERKHLQPIVAGHFEDEFERVDGRWRFAEHYAVVKLVGDLSERLFAGTQPYV